MNAFYTNNDNLTPSEEKETWSQVQKELPEQPVQVLNLHWKSFWIGQAAAVLILLAGVGLYASAQFLTPPKSIEEQYDETMSSASDQLSNLKPLVLQQANDQKKPSLESTIQAIEEIDQLIDELKEDILINGISPAKQVQLKRLFATKLDFYKELILNNEDLL